MAQISLTFAPSGTGKSYRRGPHWVINEWLRDYSGVLYTNLPLFVDKIVEFYILKYPKDKQSAERLRSRIVIIPDEVMNSWKHKASGPWDYFKDVDLGGAWIQLDEIHNFVSTQDAKEWVEKWRFFLGELRHRGLVQFECISQYETKIATAIRHEAGLDRSMYNCEDFPHPWTGATFKDWWTLCAAFTGEYKPIVFEREYHTVMKKKVTRKTVQFCIEKQYYDLYDSYSKPIAGGSAGDASKAHIWKTKTKWEMVQWFFARNYLHLLLRVLGLVVLLYLFAFGGITRLSDGFVYMAGHIGPALDKQKSQEKADKATQKPKSVSISSTTTLITSAAGNDSNVNSDDTHRHQQDVQIAEIKEKLALLEEKEKHGWKCVFISSRHVSFENGQSFQIWEIIGTGPYQGKVISYINFKKRYFQFSTGEIVWLVH